jgi:type IV pilus assembly protein PilB
MGISAFDVASAVSLIIAQRLVRKICPKCNKVNTSTCNNCHDGYKDRIAVFEMLPITQALQAVIIDNYSQLKLEQKLQAWKIPSLREAAMQKVQAGITDIAEVNRVMV